MPYCQKGDVKFRLAIDSGDLSFDTEIEGCIEEADAVIDIKLKDYTSVPLSSVPVLIKHVSSNLAAGLFQRRRQPLGEFVDMKQDAATVNVYWRLGMDLLDIYIEETFSQDTIRVA
jgi:hypothetical protein